MAGHISKPVREDLDKLGPEKKARVLDAADRIDRPPAPYPDPSDPKIVRPVVGPAMPKPIAKS